MSRQRAQPLARGGVALALVGTLLVHTLGIALVAFGFTPPVRHEPPVYAVELVAAPLPTANTRLAPESATPPAPPAAPEAPPAKPAKVKPMLAPRPKPRTPARVDPKREPAPRTRSQTAPLPGETPGTGSDIANVRLEGKAFPFPEYLRNIVSQIYRRWDRPYGTAALSAEISFTIMRDGSVRDIKVLRTSRSFPFDLEAQGSIEQAGRDRAFGPLPAGWASDILQVAFSFTPRQQP